METRCKIKEQMQSTDKNLLPNIFSFQEPNPHTPREDTVDKTMRNIF